MLSPPPTQPTSKLPESDQVVRVLVQQGEGAVGRGVSVLFWVAEPRDQQPIQALELGPVQPVLPLHEGAIRVTVAPRRRLSRCHRTTVAPVQTDQVLRLKREGERYTVQNMNGLGK